MDKNGIVTTELLRCSHPRLMGTKTRRMTVRNYIKLARFVHQIKMTKMRTVRGGVRSAFLRRRVDLSRRRYYARVQ